MMKLLLIAALVQAAILKVQGYKTHKVIHNLVCNSNSMQVSVKALPYHQYKDLQMLDPKCKLKLYKDGNFRIGFQLDHCGTTVHVGPEVITYTNKVVGRYIPKNAIITRIKNVEVLLKCRYPRHHRLTSNAIKPNRDKFRGASTKSGNFKFFIKMYPTNKFLKPYVKYPVHKHLRERFHVEVSVKSYRNQLAILAQNCYATPSRNANDKIRHALIVKSCPADKTLRFHSSPRANIQRFSAQTFRFVGHQKFFFVHCHVIVCNGANKNSVCAKGCKRIGKREESELEGMETVQLTQGPFAVQAPEVQLDEGAEQADAEDGVISYN